MIGEYIDRAMTSLPSRGAWIEMGDTIAGLSRFTPSLPSRGAWIEITLNHLLPVTVKSRSPRGERGLKLLTYPASFDIIMSLPSRGAWIEIGGLTIFVAVSIVAPLAGSVD